MALTNIEVNVILDLYDHNLTQSTIKAIALDKGSRYVKALIRDRETIYDIGADTQVVLTVIRPDKTGVQITGQPSSYTSQADDGSPTTVYGAYAELTQTALAIKGTLQAQFKFTNGQQILRSEIFTINNGVALDAETNTWAGEYQGYNLDELVQTVNESSAKVDAMEQDVSELKSGFSDLEESINVYSDVSLWEQGGIASADGKPLSSNTRIRTITYIDTDINVVKLNDGYKVCVMLYKQDGTFKGIWNGTTIINGSLSWLTGTVDLTVVPSVYKIRLIGANEGNTNIAPSDATNFVFSAVTDVTLSISGKPADARATGNAITSVGGTLTPVINSVYKTQKHTANLFNKGDPRNTSGQYWMADGTLRTGQSASYYTTHPIMVGKGTYRFTGAVTFGQNMQVVAVVDENGNYIDSLIGTVTNTSVVRFTVDKPCFIEVNTVDSYIKYLMLCLDSEYPDLYQSGIPYDTMREPDIEAIHDNFADVLVPQKNLFNYEDGKNTSGEYWYKGGYKYTGQSASYYTTHPVLVSNGTYKFTVASTFGANGGVIAVVDKDKNLIEMLNATVTDGVGTIEIGHPCLVSFNTTSNLLHTTVFCEASQWDGTYHAYDKKISGEYIDISGIEKEDTTFWSWEKSANLLDLSDPVIGKRFEVLGSHIGDLVDYSGRPVISVYVPLDGAGTYVTKVLSATYGSGCKYVVLFDADKKYLAQIEGTLDDPSERSTASGITFVVTDAHIASGAKYLGLTLFTPTATNIMVVKSDTYPSEYIPFSEGWYQHDLTVGEEQAPAYTPNPLYHKTILFDGDSICASSTDRADKGSFAGRIADANHMNVRNYAVGGGTLTSEMYLSDGTARHWVSGTVDTMYADFPDADYVIFEGGTNDADLVGSILNGNVPQKFGSVTANDFSGNYDAETFCGAVETIIYKAVTYWPTKKTGFIIAPKMGTNVNSYNNRRAYFNKIIEICEKWGMPYIDLWNNCPINPNLLSCYDPSLDVAGNVDAHKMYIDGQHPTPTGYDRITPIIEEWLRTL